MTICFDVVFAVFVFYVCGFFHTCVGIPKQLIFSKPDLKIFLTSDMAGSPLKWKIGRLWSKSFNRGGDHTQNLFVLVLFLLFLFLTCVFFSTHVWEFPNRWFFPRLIWRCFWLLTLHGHIWNEGGGYYVINPFKKYEIQLQIQKVPPLVWKKTHMFVF